MTAASRRDGKPHSEAALVRRWLDGLPGPLRLADGRPLKVIFPGVPGPGPGPDISGAILDAGGDYLCGAVEVHLRTSGWRAHGHFNDPAYDTVVLHLVAENDSAAAATVQGNRQIPLLVAPPEPGAGAPQLPGFTPPCALETARGRALTPPLDALARRRFRIKAARVPPGAGPGEGLYRLLLRTAGGPANGDAFDGLATAVPLPALLELAAGHEARALALVAGLRPRLADLSLRRSGIRPAARPERRLEIAARLVAALWPEGQPVAWPAALPATLSARELLRVLRVEGAGRSLAIELAVNAVLPAAAATGAWPEERALDVLLSLPTPGTYGHLQRLESWLGHGGERPFSSAGRLQAGMLLHADYCSRGRCGRCPLSS